METRESLTAEIEFLDACLTQIHERAGDGALTAEQDAEFKAGLALRDEKRDALKVIEKRHAEIERLAATKPENVVPGSFQAPAGHIVKRDAFDLSDLSLASSDSEIRSRGLRAVEQVTDLTDAQREQAERLVRSLDPKEVSVRLAATGSELYRQAFSKAMAGPAGLASMTPDEVNAFARAQSLTDNAGGYAVPFTLDPTIILTSDGSANPFRQISRVAPITTDTWNGVSTAGVSASFGAEASAITENSATLAQPSITAHKATCQVNYSFEIGGDWAGIQSDLLMLIVDAKDTLEATKFAIGAGNGSNEPVGIVTALTGTSSEINAASAESFTVADLYALEEALGPRFRPNASWVANKAWYNKVRQFDTNGGANLWERIGAGMPAELLGYPAYEASAMDSSINAAATANNYVLILGDFRNYVIADRVGLSLEPIQHVVDGDGKLTGQRGLLAWWRVGADSVNDAAFSMLDIPTTA